jgi:hypothetical protein
MQGKNLLMVWLAITFAVVIYGVVAWIVIGPKSTGPIRWTDPIILGLHLAGVTATVAAFLVPITEPKRYVLRWALFDSTAIFGLIAAFLGSHWHLVIPLGLVALAGLLLSHPSQAEAAP